MDDSEPRLPVGGEPVASRSSLPSLTLLADADETELRALEDWSRGLDWVQWLLSGVRNRRECLHFQPDRPALGSIVKLKADWRTFASGRLCEVLVPHLLQAWRAVQDNQLEAFKEADLTFSGMLPKCECENSRQAGGLLLKATRRARYQGMLGHYRVACDSGVVPGHFLTVWAAVGHFFQLSLVSVVSEYLRLEWMLANRHREVAGVPDGFVQLVACLLRPQVTEIRVVA